ncbi:MAG: bifunctional [glutamate--ammonia ligase]-adenylyl-L-tyrosine phosphorylase/[glutamate--ammonia-ligase] adenylyltransferase [Methylobacillus sp.]|jgi:glutamate-ammonia-ligase adenylyltransferase|nr:bifunctional [glutamate--ammonia ligase]-adenylyl-L-tyrosine phosphorylase/[glutamate--ammonia-ligase] adenylyltransferase [Methylobacillus sp.]
MTTLVEMLDAADVTNETAQLRHALFCSHYMRRTLEADPALLAPLRENMQRAWSAEEMRGFLGGFSIGDETTLKHALRKLRQHVMLRVIARDLNRLCDLEEVMATMTALAEVGVNFALDHLDRWQRAIYGTPVGEDGEAQQLIVIGMGKLGGRELNVSSDIDLIFAFGESGETDGAKKITNNEYFSALGKKLIAAIGETTADGFVFRMDMRLRPYGDSGPLVGSLAMLEQYYQAQGREWERYAWIKGRVIAGAERELQSLMRPFVYRKYLDYSAFASMRDLKAQIQREVARRDMRDNIKLGPGGIREIEFIAQVFQLVRGGRDGELQIRPTLAVLDKIADKGLLPRETVNQLSAAYVFLRDLEHRLQYLQDAQTQMLPSDDDSRIRIARGMGYDVWDDFMAALQSHRDAVERHFSEVFSIEQESGAETAHPLNEVWAGGMADDDADNRLAAHGYANAAEARYQLQTVKNSGRYQQLPGASRERFDALLPAVLRLAGATPNPDDTLKRMLQLLESICRRASYLALLAEYPQALQLVTRLASASPWLAGYLAQYPILLDELLDTRTLYAAPDFAQFAADLDRRLAEAEGDIEQQMDIMRHFKHAHTFRFAAQDLAGDLPLETLSDYLSALADLILAAVLKTVWPHVRGKHRDTPAFAIIGYGKLGGKELGYASDLDIIFLHEDAAPEAGEVYARFGQRIGNWLNSPTSAGLLYDTDLRLRPDGASGLLVSAVEAFEHYQKNKAWTWEHQALTRARFVAGDAAIGEKFDCIRDEILRQPRDLEKLRADVIAMRQKMHEGHPNKSDLFDIKHDSGGIVDVEFIVQYLVLAHARQHPELTLNHGNIALLGYAGKLGLIPADLAKNVANAYREFRRHQHASRLQGETRQTRIAHENASEKVAAVRALWELVLG